MASIESHIFCEEVTAHDLTTAGDGLWTLECRCGGEYKINIQDIECGFKYFFCSNCSLKIYIKEK